MTVSTAAVTPITIKLQCLETVAGLMNASFETATSNSHIQRSGVGTVWTSDRILVILNDGLLIDLE
jgi:hypothetical protein